MNKNALYYPHIALKNSTWIKAMSLLYDNIYRIVPPNVLPEDSMELYALLEEGSVGKMIDPTPYCEDTADEFLLKLDDWDAAAFEGDQEGEQQLAKIHEDKIDRSVKKLFEDAGFKSENDWMSIPTEIASHYMLYLANDISRKNNLSLITGDWGAWTGTSYFNLDGRLDDSITPVLESDHNNDPFGLFSLIVSEITPINIAEIPSEDILEFRLKRSDEISNFRSCIGELRAELHKTDSSDIQLDVIDSKVKELLKAKLDYQQSADLIKAKGWFGISMMGFPAPVVFGKLMSIPTASTVVLGATGLALGAMYSIKHTENELKKLSRDRPVSLLVEMEHSFKNYTSARGGGDINHHAWNCMEEFIND